MIFIHMGDDVQCAKDDGENGCEVEFQIGATMRMED